MSTKPEASGGHVTEPAHAVRPAVGVWRRRRGLIIGGVAVVLVLAALGAARATGLLGRLFKQTAGEESAYVVQPTTLNVSLQEDGELKPVKSVDIKVEVQGQSVTIQSIVEESTRVKKGDLLVKLSSEDMRDRVLMEEIELRSARAALEEAEQSLAITKSENASRIKKAEIDLAVAELELTRYVEGDYEKSQAAVDISIKQTEMDISQKENELEKSLKLLVQEFISQSKIDELRDALEKARMTLRMNNLEREILQKYELPKNDLQKRSAVEQAREELDRERQRADSRQKQAESKAENQKGTLVNREQRFERLKEQLAKCEIRAPSDGVVQYGDSGGDWRWGGNRIAVGEKVYDGQTLITLPDTSKMMVTTRIHEADRHKITEGLTCLVRIPAVPERTFVGKLSKIAQFADSGRTWWNPELKEHATEIVLDETDAPLSPGDTAHVEILIEEVPNVLAAPVQCVFARGAKRFVFVRRGVSAEPVEVKVGRSSTTLIEVTEGLSAGDKVLMAPDEQLLAKLPSPGSDQSEQGKAGRRPRLAASQPGEQPTTQATQPTTDQTTQPTTDETTEPTTAPATQPEPDEPADE